MTIKGRDVLERMLHRSWLILVNYLKLLFTFSWCSSTEISMFRYNYFCSVPSTPILMSTPMSAICEYIWNVTINERYITLSSEIKFLVLIFNQWFFKFFIFLSDELVFFFHALFYLLLITSHQLTKSLRVVVVDIFVDSRLQPFHEFLLDFLLNVGSDQGLGFSHSIPPFSFFLDGDNFFFSLQFQLSHLDDHLS